MSKSTQRKERMILLMMAGVLLILIIFFSSLMVQNHREYTHFKVRESRIEAKFIQARKELAQKEMYFAQLLDDTDFLERVVRERLGYTRPDELLFRFSEEP